MNWKEHIVEAFERARAFGRTGEVRPVNTISLRLEQAPEVDATATLQTFDLSTLTPREISAMQYTQAEADEFHAEAATLFEQSVVVVDAFDLANLAQSKEPQDKHRRSSHIHRSYFIGELPEGPVDYTKAIERCVRVLEKKKEPPKQSLVAKVANTKVF